MFRLLTTEGKSDLAVKICQTLKAGWDRCSTSRLLPFQAKRTAPHCLLGAPFVFYVPLAARYRMQKTTILPSGFYFR
ncbi:MAG: hypothetical protein LBO67_06545 [Spirochaetaceae bacterium]|nr:hypothetical protein [Spirochaetaceae bacterium]